MQIVVDTNTSKILWNGKALHIDVMDALKMAPVGTAVDVVDNDQQGIVTILVRLPKD